MQYKYQNIDADIQKLKPKSYTIKQVSYKDDNFCNLSNFFNKLYKCENPKPHMKGFCDLVIDYRERNCKITDDLPPQPSESCISNPCPEHYNCIEEGEARSCIPDINYHPAIGEACSEDFVCDGMNTICHNNVCETPCDPNPCDNHYICNVDKINNLFSCDKDESYIPGLDQYCSEDFACQSPLQCNVNNVCKKPSNSDCVSDNECLSNTCSIPDYKCL